jgi:hypothetical protein
MRSQHNGDKRASDIVVECETAQSCSEGATVDGDAR